MAMRPQSGPHQQQPQMANTGGMPDIASLLQYAPQVLKVVAQAPAFVAGWIVCFLMVVLVVGWSRIHTDLQSTMHYHFVSIALAEVFVQSVEKAITSAASVTRTHDDADTILQEAHMMRSNCNLD
jgi:hypothetical protein